MLYPRAWLKDQAKSYLKDSSVSVELDTWVDISLKRVGRILRCNENTSTVQVTIAAGADVAIPWDTKWVDVLGVQYEDNGGMRELAMIPKIARYRNAAGTGKPAGYIVEPAAGGLVEVRPLPAAAGNYALEVVTEIELETDASSVPAVNAYPFLFLNAVLAEAYDWKQDTEMVTRYEGKWVAEAQAITDAWKTMRIGNQLTMRAG